MGKYGSVGYGANRTINKHVLDNISSPYPAASHYRDYIDGEDTAWDYFEEGESLSETDHTDWDYYNEGEDQSAYAGQDQRLRDMTPGSAAHLAKPEISQKPSSVNPTPPVAIDYPAGSGKSAMEGAAPETGNPAGEDIRLSDNPTFLGLYHYMKWKNGNNQR